MTGESPDHLDSASCANEDDRVLMAYRRREARGADSGQYFGFESPSHVGRQLERGAVLLEELQSAGVSALKGLRILDLGAGDGSAGRQLSYLSQGTATTLAVDLRKQVVMKAERGMCARGSALPVNRGSVDMVLLFTVLSSVASDEARQRIALEARRVVSSDGTIIVYDMVRRNPRNADVRPLSDQQVGTMFPGCMRRFRRLTLAPPVARRLNPCGVLAPALAKVRLLQTHGLWIVRPSA